MVKAPRKQPPQALITANAKKKKKGFWGRNLVALGKRRGGGNSCPLYQRSPSVLEIDVAHALSKVHVVSGDTP